ncbi:hypothetical protein XH80_15785 [Bradyrhizobium sp. CCBAU 45384]|nr:hypothetical protein [Bradyrhizobium sp. CCBAU 45384]
MPEDVESGHASRKALCPLGPVAPARRQNRHIGLEVRHDGDPVGIAHQDLEHSDLEVHSRPPLPIAGFDNDQTGHRIKYLKVDADTGDELPNEDIVKGYELDKGQYIEVTKEELEEIALESTRTIEIDEFVDKTDIDPRYLIRPYYIRPDGKVGHDAFAVIRETIREMDKVAIGCRRRGQPARRFFSCKRSWAFSPTRQKNGYTWTLCCRIGCPISHSQILESGSYGSTFIFAERER